ncbi:NB-ARC domain-containing protein [Microcoleus sp. herbarium7]|uniref:WD40 domain-containing protein n=1 Tax=Microcoleus sp. herbarium7 TaxID=3055435 RepID=UPI002FD19651
MSTLKASPQGLTRIKQARIEKGWAVDDFRWLQSASQVLDATWEEDSVLAVGISPGTWKRFLAGKFPINTEAFKAYCQVLGLNWEEVVDRPEDTNTNKSLAIQNPKSPIPNRHDWGEATDVSIFYGREEELNTVQQWIVQENCRLITLLGMGGIGKTSLSVKLAHQIQDRFELIIWRSLRNSPPIDEILVELIQFLSNQEEANLPTQIDGKISRLLKYLRSCRCLIILDNLESILQAGDRTGSYRPGCEVYGQLLQIIGDTSHQSCLILTSREKPKGLAALEGESLPVRSLQLAGLPATDGRSLFDVKGTFTGTDAQWQILIDRYAGNPLAIKIVASSIRDFFDGNIAQFLQISQKIPFLFDDIRELLDQQFQRLTTLEQQIMYWLAINREPISWQELQSDFVAKLLPRELLESLNSLQRRSLIEKNSGGFTQQPVVMEYVTNRIIEQVCEEIREGETILNPIAQQPATNFKIPTYTPLLQTHALIKATAKEYVRETQVNLILKSIADRLVITLGSREIIASHLQKILVHLQGKPAQETGGYAGGNILNLLQVLQIDVSGYDFSQLTVWQAYLQGVNLHDVNFTNSDLSRCVFTESLGNILWTTFSPDGQLLATCDTDCQVRLWEVQTGQLVLMCEGHSNWVRFVAFNPDGQTLASCGADCTVKLWSVRDGVCIKTLTGHQHEVFAVAFSPDGQILASGSGDKTVKLWDVRTGSCIKTLNEHTDWVRTIALSPDGKMLASGSSDHTIKLWDMRSGRCLKTLNEHTAWVRSVAFSSDGEILASGSGDRTIKLWNIATGECLKTYNAHLNSVYSVAFSPHGDILVSGSGDCTAKLWDWHTDTCIRTLHGHTNEVCCVAFNADGHTLACVSLDQTLKLWDCRTGQCLKTWYGHTDWALPVAFSPIPSTTLLSKGNQGGFLASGSSDKTVRLWDWQTGECVAKLPGHTDFIYGIAFSKDGQMLATGSTDSSVRLWNVARNQCFQVLQGHTDWVYAVAFHSDGQTVASGSADCTLKLWDISGGQCLKTFTGHTDKILGIAFSPDGNILASASVDHSIKLWDICTDSCIKTLHGHDNRVYAAVFSPDGQTLASCSTDRTVKLWDIVRGKCLKTLTGHTNWVFSVAFSPDGQTLASASHDRTVRLWDVTAGECDRICLGHTHLVSSVAFNPNGQFIASGSQDQTVRVWDVKTGECVRVLIAKRLYEGMRLTGVKGLAGATIETLRSLGAVV